jgi:hypothetical protein
MLRPLKKLSRRQFFSKRHSEKITLSFRGSKKLEKTKMKKLIIICAVVLMVSSMVSAADVPGWNAFVIRNSNVGNIAPTISDPVGGKLFQIVLAGQKAGWGTNNMNGKTIGDVQLISIIRDPNVTGWGPYMNFWVTDGSGGYAVIANEPSNTGEWGTGTAYNTTWDVLKNATAKVYETGSGFITPPGKTVFTFNDFAGYIIATPTSHWGGTGAPDDLNAGSYTAYGVNRVFGDTQSNYLGGYLVSTPTVATSYCPEPLLVGDLDGDCRVNFIDFAMMAENWLKSNLVTQEASLDNLQWSVQYMIDTSQTDFGQPQNPSPRDNRGLAISPDGRYLYAGYNNGPAVRRIDLTVSDYIDAADIQITGVRGKSIDVDDMGKVYLAEGTSIKIYNADLSSNLFNLTGLTNSEGVAVTRENRQLVVYNSDRNDGTLKKWLLIESGGSITSATLDTTFGTGGTVTLAANLRGVKVDSNGKIWVAGYGNNTVYRVSSDGLTVDSISVSKPIDIDFIAGTALVSRYTDRVISRFDMNTMLSAGADIAVPWTALELDPDGQSAGGALSGIAIFGNGFFVANETGQTADEKSTYGRTDGNSGYIADKFYTDLYNDDNDPILLAIPVPATINCSGPLVGDLDNDCKVNYIDLAKMAENWLNCNLQPPEACQ